MSISYFSQGLGLDTIPNFLSSKSERGLRRLMLMNNTKHKGFVVYQDIQFIEKKDRWFAWYYVQADMDMKTGEVK